MTRVTADGLQVIGKQLATANGHPFVIKGITQYWNTYAGSGNTPDGAIDPISNAYYDNRATVHPWLAEQGINLIRLGLGANAYAAETYMTRANYRTALATLVKSATDAGLYVQLQNWDALGDGENLPDTYTGYHTFWSDLSPIVRGNPRVIVAPHNEPHNLDSAAWQTVYIGELDFWRNEMGYGGIIVLNTRDWSHNLNDDDLTAVFTHDAGLRGDPALLVGIHQYMDDSPDDPVEGYLEAHKAIFDNYYLSNGNTRWPVFIDETGNENNGSVNGADTDDQTTGLPGGTSNLRLWLEEFHHSLATDEVPNMGLNGVTSFQLHWVDYNGMVNDLTDLEWNAFWGQIFYDNYLSEV
jgi:hypothetical protein